jgi:predicted transcriptional regulator
MTNTIVVCVVMTDHTKLIEICSSSPRTKHDLSSSPLHKKYRSHFEIIALLLEAVKDNGATRFSIMKHASINYNQLKKYLHSLTEIGFINIDRKEERCFYRTTGKGLDFLRQYYVLIGMLLNAFERNKPTSIAYEAEYYATGMQQRSATPLVTSLQHNP